MKVLDHITAIHHRRVPDPIPHLNYKVDVEPSPSNDNLVEWRARLLLQTHIVDKAENAKEVLHHVRQIFAHTLYGELEDELYLIRERLWQLGVRDKKISDRLDSLMNSLKGGK